MNKAILTRADVERRQRRHKMVTGKEHRESATKGRCEVSIDKAMENGIHCVGCTFVTTQLKPSDMYCPWCMKEAQDRIAELEAMVREFTDTCSCVQMMLRDSPVRCILCTRAIALIQPEAGKEVGR